ncbi:MAG: hypothetical protein ABIH69_03575 [bacterium]
MEVLGLLDTLESMVLDGTKIPLTKKVMVNEDAILAVIDKMRLVVQGGGGFAKEAIASKQMSRPEPAVQATAEETIIIEEVQNARTKDDSKAVEVLQQAYQMAKEIREGADTYADEVLANLEATSTRILRTIKAGRDRLGNGNKGVEVTREAVRQ